MKVGNRVAREPMWKHPRKEGTVIKITSDYVVVKWDEVNGEWHYTFKQAESLKIIEEK